MEDTYGKTLHKALDIVAYDVLEVSRDRGMTWLDFSTLRTVEEVTYALGLVRAPVATTRLRMPSSGSTVGSVPLRGPGPT